MNNDSFIKIEDKKMPVCDFDYPDLDINNSYSSGFANFVFIAGLFTTSFMWIILNVFWKVGYYGN